MFEKVVNFYEKAVTCEINIISMLLFADVKGDPCRKNHRKKMYVSLRTYRYRPISVMDFSFI